MTKEIISTENAPKAIGTYSQAIKKNNIVFLSGQIGLDPKTMELVDGIENQINQVFKNLLSVIEAAGGKKSDIVKLNIFLTKILIFKKKPKCHFSLYFLSSFSLKYLTNFILLFFLKN